MHVTGKWEFEVDPERSEIAYKWVESMLKTYEREIGRMTLLNGPAGDHHFRLDDSVRGLFSPLTGQIHIFYAEENDLASRAEELAHYFQYQRLDLLGKTEEEIGTATIDDCEVEMKEILVKNGFRIRR